MRKTFKKDSINIQDLLKFFNKYFQNIENKEFEIWASIWTIKNELLNKLSFCTNFSSENTRHCQILLWAIQRYNLENDIILDIKETSCTTTFWTRKYNTLNIKYK